MGKDNKHKDDSDPSKEPLIITPSEDTEIDSVPEVEPDSDADSDTGSKTETEAENETDVEPETETEAETENENDTDTEADGEINTETEPAVEAEPETEAETETEADPVVERESHTDIDTETDAERDADVKTELKLEAESDPEPKEASVLGVLEPESESKQTPLSVSQSFRLPVQEIESDGKGKIIAAVIGAILLIIAIVAVGYTLFVYKPSDLSSAVETPEPTKQAVTLNSAEAVAKAAASVVKLAPVTVTVDNSTGFASVKPSNMTVYSYPTYQLASRDFAAGPASGHGLAVSAPEKNKAAIDKDYEALVSLLENGGFKAKKSLDQDELAEGNKSVLYATNTTVCAVYALYYMETSYASIGCADMKSYEEHAKVVEPFYNALVAKLPGISKSTDGPLTLRGPMIKNGNNGYKTAFIATPNETVVLFYQAPEKNWQYVTGATGIVPIPCKDFDTPDARKAFAGTECYDTTTDTDSTVKG